MKPTVRVIAYTRFPGGVPLQLCPSGALDVPLHQDNGSDLARLVECAGRTCYDSYGRGRSSEDYHRHILDVGHGSVLEHASISFYICGISRGCSHELVRHRAGTAISQRSTRYVDESESEWAWHPLVDEFFAHSRREANGPRGGFLNRLLGQWGDVEKSTRAFYAVLADEIERFLIEVKGLDKTAARKQARGAARGALGNALETAMVWTANLRALRNVIEQRASEFADAEIRLLANALLEAAVEVCPEYFSDYERVPCPDGIGYGVRTPYRKV